MSKKLIEPEDFPIHKVEPDLNFKWHHSWTKEDIEGFDKWVKRNIYNQKNFNLGNFEKNED